jgi:hypothetical protein
MIRRKYAFAALLVIVAAGFAMLSPTVRAAASDFLGLFRVEKFAPISVSARQLETLERIADQGLTPGELELLGDEPSSRSVSSLEEAAAQVGWTVASPRLLGAPDTIHVTDGAAGRLTIDLAASRLILSSAGLDPSLLPSSLEGQPVDVTLYPMAAQAWQDAGITLIQTDSPLIAYPADVDPELLGGALLQLLGMSEAEASRLSASIDWTNTLLMPIPTEFATFSEVTIDGASGLALSSLDGAHSSLMWEKAGRLYFLEGQGTVRELVRVAGSLR